MSRLCFLLILFIFLFRITSSFSQDSVLSEKNSYIAFSGYIKDMQIAVIHNVDENWITNNLIHNRLNLTWNITKNLIFGAGERNRLYWGELTGLGPQYKEFVTLDNGLVNMSWNVASGNSYLLNATIDRLWLDYTIKKFQVTAGRQRINWSQTYVWNPNDIFNTYSYFDFDYEEKPGSDAVRLQYFTGPSSKAEVAVKAEKGGIITGAALYRFNRWKYDFQGMAGFYRNNDLALGLGWAGQIAGGGFKGELTWFHPFRNFSDSAGVFLTSVEYDYTFRNSIFIQFEGFYNSNTANSANVLISQYNPQLLNAKNPFLNGFSLFANISYPVSPLITLALAGIYNPGNEIYFIIPTFTLSLMNNLDLSILAQSFQSYNSDYYRYLQTSVFIRLKESF